MTDDRESSIDFGSVDEDLESVDYPATTDELVEEFGDQEIEYESGTETLGELLGPLQDTFKDPEEVRQAIFTMVSEDADGRLNYTDRGTSVQDEEFDQQSL